MKKQLYNKSYYQQRKRQYYEHNKKYYARVKFDIKTRFVRAKASAKNHGFTWTLSYIDFEKLVQEPCFYCHESFVTSGSGLDQKESRAGYAIDNVVSCCPDCNKVKSDVLTFEEMCIVSQVLREFRATRNRESYNIS